MKFGTWLFCVQLPSSEWGPLEVQLTSRISISLLARVQRMRCHEDRLRSMLGELLLGYALRYIGADSDSVEMCFNEFGKPSFKHQVGLHFNISHAGCWVACALSSAPVGVDIEQIRDMDFLLAHRLFHPSEVEDLMSKLYQQKLTRFFELWTAKESYVKYLGCGLQRRLDSFIVNFECPQNPKLTDVNGKALATKIQQWHLEDEYLLTLCLMPENFLATFMVLSVDLLCCHRPKTEPLIGS